MDQSPAPTSRPARSWRPALALALLAFMLLAQLLPCVRVLASTTDRSNSFIREGRNRPPLVAAAAVDDLVYQLSVAWNAQNWPEALRLIDEIIAIDPNYDGIFDQKYRAHVNFGFQLLTEARCTESLHQFRLAQTLSPDGEEVLMGLDLLSRYCATPVPPTLVPTPGPTAVPPQPPPPPVPTSAPVVLDEPVLYLVQPGDTLHGLAYYFGTTVQAIMQANGMMNYYLRAGEEIWIPASGPPPPGPIVHIVQPGETLYSTADEYQTTVWAIRSANQLRSHHIWAYQALLIPTQAQVGVVIHIVQPGETLYDIATWYGLTVPILMMANSMDTYTIRVYQRLVIPPPDWAGWPHPSQLVPPVRPPWKPAPPHRRRVYVVEPGDTLYSIAVRFGTRVRALKVANGLSSSFIYVGMHLRIP